MAVIARALKGIAAALLWLVIVVCLLLTIVPHFLDARYYRGPVSDHFDGERFVNPDGDDGLPVANTGSMLRYITASDARPLWPSRAVVTPAKPPARVMAERMLVTWVGHSSVLVQTNGINILTDPVWSDSAGPFGFGPTRVAEPGHPVRGSAQDRPRARQPRPLRSYGSGDAQAAVDRDKPQIVTSLGNDSVIGQAGVPATARGLGRARGGASRDRRHRQPRPSLGQPVVRRS